MSRRRWLARAALVTAVVAALLPLFAAGVRGSVGLVLVAVVAVAATFAAAWWFLTHRGFLRWAAAVVAVAAPVAAAVLVARRDLLWVVVLTAALLVAAVAIGLAALSEPDAQGWEEQETPPPRQPFLIMNPRSGGGKVVRFDLARLAREAGAEVFLLEGTDVDVTAVAQEAVARGADLLGVAGGDGTQALVAGVAADHDIPFMVISAGTRNHFALDLGLDREDPTRSIEALTDGVEVRVDLGSIAGRPFVNNASFGAYASIVLSPAYRDDKVGTTLDLLPDLLSGHRETSLQVTTDGRSASGPQAVLVSNNPYAWGDFAGLGRRDRLDTHVLGVLAVTVGGTADAVRLARGFSGRSVWRATSQTAVIDADGPWLAVGVDGEALVLPTPVHCVLRPGALRVRVPRHRPGLRQSHAPLDSRRLLALALSHGDGAVTP